MGLSVPALLKRAQPAGTTLLCLAACTACAPPVPADIVVTHVNIVDVERGLLLTDRTIAVRAGRIERIDSGGPAKRRARVVLDGTNRYVLPGLWDMHVHVGDDARTLGRLLGWGITGVRDMGSELDEMLAVRARQLARPHLGPRVFFGGPALRGARDSADTGLAVVRSPEVGRRTVALLAGRDVDFIKVHEGLTGDAWYAIAAAARAHGLPLTGTCLPDSGRNSSRTRACDRSSTWSFWRTDAWCFSARRSRPAPPLHPPGAGHRRWRRALRTCTRTASGSIPRSEASASSHRASGRRSSPASPACFPRSGAPGFGCSRGPTSAARGSCPAKASTTSLPCW